MTRMGVFEPLRRLVAESLKALLLDKWHRLMGTGVYRKSGVGAFVGRMARGVLVAFVIAILLSAALVFAVLVLALAVIFAGLFLFGYLVYRLFRLFRRQPDVTIYRPDEWPRD